MGAAEPGAGLTILGCLHGLRAFGDVGLVVYGLLVGGYCLVGALLYLTQAEDFVFDHLLAWLGFPHTPYSMSKPTVDGQVPSFGPAINSMNRRPGH